MTCIHGLGSSFLDYAICDTHVINCMENFEHLNEHEPESDHRALSLTLNLVMHTYHMQNISESQRHTGFDRSKTYIFLKDLKRHLGFLTYNNNIYQTY